VDHHPAVGGVPGCHQDGLEVPPRNGTGRVDPSLGVHLRQEADLPPPRPLDLGTIRLEPGRPLPYKKLGRALLSLGRGEEADEMFKAYLERDPRKRLVAQAIEHLKQGRKSDGEKMLRELRGLIRAPSSQTDSCDSCRISYQQLKNRSQRSLDPCWPVVMHTESSGH
jgi:hypothetical protein